MAFPTLHRVPSPDNRLTRFTEIVSGFVNSLVNSGLITMTGVGTWTFNGAESGIGPPPASLGVAGQIYIDVTDPTNPLLYFKT